MMRELFEMADNQFKIGSRVSFPHGNEVAQFGRGCKDLVAKWAVRLNAPDKLLV